MKLVKLLLILFFLSSIKCFAQNPHLNGTVSFSIKNGTINGDMILSYIPDVKNYTVWLNAGFNIESVSDSSGRIKYNYKRIYNNNSEEAFQYEIINKNGNEIHLPSQLRIRYTGAFPVMNDTAFMSDYGDWKGNIAFNGVSLRMSEQSVWYPVVYDSQKDILYNKYTYSIKLKSNDAGTEYLNGDLPRTGGENIFSSSTAVPLLLFAGSFNFYQRNGNYFINTGLTQHEMDILGNWTDKISNFYAAKIGIPYGSKIFYLAAKPVTKKNVWLFVSYPTIAVVGRTYSMKSIFFNANGSVIDSSRINYLAHEMGHYYFGNMFMPNSDLKWVLLEGVTEYMSLQFIKENLKYDYYNSIMSKYLSSVKEMKHFLPIDKIKPETELSDVYKYRYVPLLLTALSNKIGEEKMWQWFSYMVSSQDATTNYTFFRNSLYIIGVSDKEFKEFENRYIKSRRSRLNLINDIEPRLRN